jgi:uncharacterized protein YbjT (DUF2867 family)
MNVILFGATGMVGQGVLRECLLDPGVERVLVVVRSPTGISHTKLREVILRDFLDYSPIEKELAGYDACFFCLGVSSVGMSEADYSRTTYDITVAAAGTLARLNPAMTFIYVSGSGTDSSERGRTMWARVKGRTENALLRMPFRAVFMFRPGYIQPLHGVRSKTGWVTILYRLIGPLYPLWKLLLPGFATTTEHLGRAMIRVARDGAPTPILESADIERIGRTAG